jgi:hypothetical protein
MRVDSMPAEIAPYIADTFSSTGIAFGLPRFTATGALLAESGRVLTIALAAHRSS